MDKKRVVREIISYSKIIILSAAAAFVINHTLIVNANVPTGSMESTIMTGSRIIVNRLAYLDKGPERGDIIMFVLPDDHSQDFLKRVIGLPGDTVEGIDGDVYVNGEKLAEPYIKERIQNDFGPFVVPEDSYFVMGDNRNDSWDSRYWNKQYVARDAVIGKAEFEYYPEMKLCK